MAEKNNGNRLLEEMAFAAQDTRHEVVERMWFGRETTPESMHVLDNPFQARSEEIKPNDLYGRDEREVTTDDIAAVNRDDDKDFWEIYGKDPEPEHERDMDREIER